MMHASAAKISLKKDSSIFVAGHQGMVGSAIVRALNHAGHTNLILRNRRELDLTCRNSVRKFFAAKRPDIIVLAAAKVGGISANHKFPAEFIEQNISIESNVISEAHRAGITQLLFFGSSCIYPRSCPQPILEEYLLTGPLEPTNRPYAISKIAGIEMCWSYNRQYGTRYFTVMPPNLYGLNDNYHPHDSHVVPGLLRRIHKAKVAKSQSVIAWGTGIAQREFLFTDDLANACVFLLSLPPSDLDPLFTAQAPPLINVGSGKEITIRGLTEIIKDTVGFEGSIIWDKSKPDGTPRKILSITQLSELGWKASVKLRTGLALTYQDYVGRAYSL